MTVRREYIKEKEKKKKKKRTRNTVEKNVDQEYFYELRITNNLEMIMRAREYNRGGNNKSDELTVSSNFFHGACNFLAYTLSFSPPPAQEPRKNRRRSRSNGPISGVTRRNVFNSPVVEDASAFVSGSSYRGE